MIPIKLSRDAATYVRKETEYLRHHSQSAARRFLQAMKDARHLLQGFPEAGNHMHGLQIAGNRTLVAGDYLLDYYYNGQQIEVTSIRHGRMAVQTPDIDIEDDLENENDRDRESDALKPR